MRRLGASAIVLAVVPMIAGFGAAYPAEQASPVARHLERLRSRIEAAIPLAKGVVGVSFKHLESNTALAVSGDEPFPMASTFKLPVLVELHAMAKAGRRACRFPCATSGT